MRVKLMLAGILIISGMLSATASVYDVDQKQERQKKEKKEKKAMQAVDREGNAQATFNGRGIKAFQLWVYDNIEYPAQAKADGIGGEVEVSFIVEPDGSVTPEQVISSPDKLLGDEVMRVIKTSPKWEPGLQNWKPVRMRFKVQIVFKNNDNRIGWDDSHPRVDKSLRGY